MQQPFATADERFVGGASQQIHRHEQQQRAYQKPPDPDAGVLEVGQVRRPGGRFAMRAVEKTGEKIVPAQLAGLLAPVATIPYAMLSRYWVQARSRTLHAVPESKTVARFAAALPTLLQRESIFDVHFTSVVKRVRVVFPRGLPRRTLAATC